MSANVQNSLRFRVRRISLCTQCPNVGLIVRLSLSADINVIPNRYHDIYTCLPRRILRNARSYIGILKLLYRERSKGKLSKFFVVKSYDTLYQLFKIFQN